LEISSTVEPYNAKFANHSAEYLKTEIFCMTLGCYRIWALVLAQDTRRMTLTGKEAPELTVEQTVLSGLLSALT
jgi:hypothetical protein